MRRSIVSLSFLFLSTSIWAVDPLSIKSCKVLEKEMKDALQKMVKIKDNIFELASDPEKFAKAEAEMQSMAAKNAILAQQKEKLKCKFTLEVDANNVVKSVKETKEKIEAEKAENNRWFVNGLCTCSTDYGCNFCSTGSYGSCNSYFTLGNDWCYARGCSYKHYASVVLGQYDTEYGKDVLADFYKSQKKSCADTKLLSDAEIKVIKDDFISKLNEERVKAVKASFLKYYKVKLKNLLCADEEEKCFSEKAIYERANNAVDKSSTCPCSSGVDAMDYDTAQKEYEAYAKKVLEKRFPTGEIPKGEKKVKLNTLSTDEVIYSYEHLK